jgi:hypothetical protein
MIAPWSESGYISAEDFLDRMDLDVFEGRFNTEVKKLSREQLEEVAAMLIRRSGPIVDLK